MSYRILAYKEIATPLFKQATRSFTMEGISVHILIQYMTMRYYHNQSIDYMLVLSNFEQAGAAALTQVQSSTSGTLPVNANAIMASTSSVNGSFVWLYDGQQTDMNLTRIALTSNSNGGGYASYVSKVFSPVGLPSWNTYYPCMACQRGTTWYIIRYYQSVAPMVYTSFIIDLKDDRYFYF